MTDTPDTPRDYRNTVFLPKTDFPMKAGLAAKEPAILARWAEEGLYAKLREARAGRERFILHDGPPYANGDIHMGHAMNKVLKDIIVRSQSLMGKDAPYVPGWDCHGLPIEWKVEEAYRARKLDKDQVPVAQFRAECRAYAEKWVAVQRAQFERLGVMGDWDDPYLTMAYDAEATIVGEMLKFAESGQLYRGAKPVMWSPVEKTALAEAEVEYEDIVSTQIDVAFEIVEAPNAPELVGAYAVIWTTTPWTIPVNQAIGYGQEIEYSLLTVRGGLMPPGSGDDAEAAMDQQLERLNRQRFLVATDLIQTFRQRLGAAHFSISFEVLSAHRGFALTGAVARHPMANFLRHPGESRGPSSPLGHLSEVAADGLSRDPLRASTSAESVDPGFRRDDGGVSAPLPLAGGVGGGASPHASPHADTSYSPAAPRLPPSREREGLSGFFDRLRPFLPGDFVTTDAGTGLVHMAPDHGEDDFLLCKQYGIDPVFAVDGAGMYRADWPWLGGQGSVINKKFVAADGPICTDLRAAGALLAASDDYKHSYPHSWRSKAKVIFRATPQWFIGMDRSATSEQPGAVRSAEVGSGTEPWQAAPSPAFAGEGRGEGLLLSDSAERAVGAKSLTQPSPAKAGEGFQGNAPTLRAIALDAIERTRWVPARAENRIRAMVESRPDWVISRQRAWGVPIALFVNRATGAYLADPVVNARIIDAFRHGGADAWFAADHQALLGPDYALADYEIVTDILDVWFDSGSTHAFVIESRYGAGTRANLYVEGSDQHRGWFQSSLLEASGTRGRAPFEAVLTHGFALDGQGRKMSKSLGNVVDPLKVIGESGADILRMWVASTDYFEDVRIGKEVLATASDAYRKLRNSFRYLLGALDGWSEAERVPVSEMPELERYVLHLLSGLDAELRAAAEAYEFNRYIRALTDFANEDLSAFFFDIRKDCLYCDAASDLERRAYRTVLDILFHALVRYAAPVLCFTAEEVWGMRFPVGGSVHLLEWPEMPLASPDAALADKWQKARVVRASVTEAIEPLRRKKQVRSSLEADVTLVMAGEHEDWQLLAGLGTDELANVFISSAVTLDRRRSDSAVSEVFDEPSLTVAVTRTKNHKCGRCWRHLPEVTDDGALCDRCTKVLADA